MFIKKLVKQSIGASLFSATWIKADGKPRTVLGKLPTNEKFFNGGELKGNRDHLLEVIDINLLLLDFKHRYIIKKIHFFY